MEPIPEQINLEEIHERHFSARRSTQSAPGQLQSYPSDSYVVQQLSPARVRGSSTGPRLSSGPITDAGRVNSAARRMSADGRANIAGQTNAAGHTNTAGNTNTAGLVYPTVPTHAPGHTHLAPNNYPDSILTTYPRSSESDESANTDQANIYHANTNHANTDRTLANRALANRLLAGNATHQAPNGYDSSATTVLDSASRDSSFMNLHIPHLGSTQRIRRRSLTNSAVHGRYLGYRYVPGPSHAPNTNTCPDRYIQYIQSDGPAPPPAALDLERGLEPRPRAPDLRARQYSGPAIPMREIDLEAGPKSVSEASSEEPGRIRRLWWAFLNCWMGWERGEVYYGGQQMRYAPTGEVRLA